jgi:putative transposase
MDNATLKEMLTKKLLTPGARRDAVGWAIKKNYSQRRACRLIGLAPKVFRYGTLRSDDGVLRTRLFALAALRRRFSYRRLHLSSKRALVARLRNRQLCRRPELPRFVHRR